MDEKTESLNEPKLNPQHRVRDGVRYGRPKTMIPFARWQEILDNAARAAIFIDPNNPIYVMMWNALNEAENNILENRVGEEREESVFGAIKRTVIREKKMNVDEMVGRLKYLRSFFAELKSWNDLKIDLEKQEADGVLLIERKEPQDVGSETV